MEASRFWFTITWSFTSSGIFGMDWSSRERLKVLYALKPWKPCMLSTPMSNVLVEKRTLVEKSKILNLKPNCIYSMQSIEQHYYRETEEQNSNGCKLLVKKDAMLNSLDAQERSYDNSTNGINFTIRKVNLMFVFIVVVGVFFFNKYVIQNPASFEYNVIMLSLVYAIVLWANFYVKLLMSPT